jgi:hypothetical protein
VIVGGEGSDVMNGATDDRPDGASADLILGLQAPSDPSDVVVGSKGSDIMNGGDCAGDDVLYDRHARPIATADSPLLRADWP